ncbi:HVO_A0114 family putative DNA-binding protein [Halococcoides cellulosivorans]|uniref:Transcriptional regulator n=1 Tax=Halococcoides cellulosivorans TaxID=1679096 RepID=A0A2R4X032_9EURY|nr:transcriptional regulator [Halococcoides cellulosivorans]AWB27147.1 transcriptional regulator [Halococcoides cellulosivorans]
MAPTGDDTTTLHVRYREGSTLESTLAAIDRGEDSDPHYEVIFDDPDDLHRVTRPRSVELLRTIVHHDPASIRETARLVDRDVSQVHETVTELEGLHLLELHEEGASKRPVVWYDAIDIDLPLTSETSGAEDVTA